MKIALQKLACLTLTLSLLLAAAGTATASLDSAAITLSASQWEARFQDLVEHAAENSLPLTDNTAFSVAEFPDPDGRVGSEHSLILADFMRLTYYDFGDDVFDSAMLTIRLDHDGKPVEMAQAAIFFTILAGDTDTTWEEFTVLMEEMCPAFEAVFAGEDTIDGVQTAVLRGVGYAMNVTDKGRFLRFYTNFALTQNDAQQDNAFDLLPDNTAENETAQADPWVGLWRYEEEDGVELLQLGADGMFWVDTYTDGQDQGLTGSYTFLESSLTLHIHIDDGAVETVEFSLLIDGDTMIINEDGIYYRVPKEREAAVLADHLTLYNSQGTGSERTLASMKQAVVAAGYEVSEQMDYYTDPSIPKPIAGFIVIHDGLKYGVKILEFASPDDADAYARFVSRVSDGIYVLNAIAVQYSLVKGDTFTDDMAQKLLAILSAS